MRPTYTDLFHHTTYFHEIGLSKANHIVNLYNEAGLTLPNLLESAVQKRQIE